MLNSVSLIGNLGRDPETKYSQAGTAVTNFSIATTEKWKDKNSGEWQKKTEWHNIVSFGRLAEICGEYLKKGSQVYIGGKIQTDTWEKNGEKRYTTKIIANEMKMLGSRPESQPVRQKSFTQGQKQTTDASQGIDGYEPPVQDDIPF